MFSYIKGTLVGKYGDNIVVENNGIGYKIQTSLTTIENIGMVGSEVTVYTCLSAREEAINLYGFISREELALFELLITVSGVGPKAAISILSSITPSKFSLAVITDDVKTLTKVKGIGNKTAQRIILELKDKIKKEQLISSTEEQDSEIPEVKDSRISEAISALMVLGYTAIEASRAVSAVYSEDMDLETIIRNSLKGLVK
ncbi:MAG TPA: Holliday junction branch migration protein RuvA [Clostridiaceae bacterium]|nr:Holliday junction branch migration protein RuvA [Clostridiaceae bacterium]